ncbi:winged helix DNA-binding domain-containing protein [Propioniciclava soli]|uniref:Winged helix DNA-binding domain-containing protein n=1 Tax=Propioniciclava soli TaxID=2775081 RepID=A0ABZ3C803_9ACTN|nr:winged helix DNA-binding domain-containing protein [Propioniciclava soli]
METSLADVARMRLVAQGLVPPLAGVVDVVRHLTCVQGQDFPGSCLSLALRSEARSLAAVTAAYDAGQIVRTWPMRGTLFVVAAEDAGWVTALTAEKTRTATARRRDELGLTPAMLERAEATARTVLAGGGLAGSGLAGGGLTGHGLPRAELFARWEDAGVPTHDGRGYRHLFHLAVAGVICQGPTLGREQRFVLTDAWIPAPRRLDRAEGVRELLSRYLRARGPAPVDDFCWWSKIGKAEARPHVADLAAAGDIVSTQVDGREFWMAPDLPHRFAEHRRATAAPLLLPGFDEIVLGYGDRSAVLTREEERLVVPGGNGVFKGTVLHRGHAVATWKKATTAGRPVALAPFGSLPAAVASAVPRLSAALPR